MMRQFNIKIDEKDLRLIQKIAKARGEGTADFARMSLRKELGRLGFLRLDDKKALEVK